MKCAAIIQARMGSSRLPGKVMMTLCGDTVLKHVVRRVSACSKLDDIIVATTTLAEDNIIADEASRMDVSVFRGSMTDVLGRYYHAATANNLDVIIRITSDCPLIDPDIIGDMLEIFMNEDCDGEPCDYMSNSLERTFPIGLDTEIFTYGALATAYSEAHRDYEREHVTPYIYQHPEKFRLRSYTNDVDLSRYRWTLDTMEDFTLIDEIYERLYKGTVFKTGAVLELLEHDPELAMINAHIRQKLLGE